MRRLQIIAIGLGLAMTWSYFMGIEFEDTEGMAGQISINSENENKLFLREGWFIRSSDKVNDSGEIISTGEFSPDGWYPTFVPSTVLAALVKNGVFEDPYFGINMRQIPHEPFECSWWYRTRFKLPGDYKGKNIRLHFDGICHKADIWLNGRKIVGYDQALGTYLSFEFDITDKVAFEELNCLALEIFPPGIRDLGINWFDWNPWPPDLNMGIWKDVYVSASGWVGIKHSHVISDLPLPDTRPARLTVSCDVVNYLTASQEGILRGEISPRVHPGKKIIFEKRVKIGPGETKTMKFDPSQFPQLIIQDPYLWWPNNVGPQNLYELRLDFLMEGESSDTEEAYFGIREVTSYLTVSQKPQEEISRIADYIKNHLTISLDGTSLCIKIPSCGLLSPEITSSAIIKEILKRCPLELRDGIYGPI